MPRSSRHKSSKHSSRDARDYSDPEIDSSVRERKSKEESLAATVSKESGSGDKRKFDTQEHYDSLNGEYEVRTSSKRHKEKIQDSGNDRWNGGDEERGETSKKSKTSSEKSRRREELEGEESKKSSSGKHRESSRRESKELEKERDKGRDRKYKEGKSDKLFDCENHHGSKIVPGKTDLKAEDQVQSPGSDNYHEKRSRRKREDHCIGHKHQGVSDKIFTSAEDCLNDGKQKEEKCRDKNRVDTEEVNKQRGDKQRDDRPEKEHPRSDGKIVCESKRRKTKLQKNYHGKEHSHEPDNGVDGYHDRPCEYESNQDYDRGRDRQRNRVRDRDRDRDRDLDRGDHERDIYHERDRDRGRSRDRDWDHERDRTHDREKDRGHDYYHDRERSKTEHDRESDRDVLYLTGQYKNCKERRSPDDQDDLSDSKSRITTPHTDIDTGGTRGQPDGDRTRSQRQPSSSVVREEMGNNLDQKAKGPWEQADLSGVSERGSKNRVSVNTANIDDGCVGEFQVERSTSTKASPRPLERRYINRTGTSRSLEVEESGQRNITRDFPASEADRILVDEISEAELSFNNKVNQNNSSFLQRPESRGGISSPKMGPVDEDSAANIAGRFKRSRDANMGRGQQSNVWRASPNWPSPVIPNGFIPFQHGPPHGGFQSMIPQFPAPSLFGIRPSMEMSHSGIPYHMANAERFSGHLRPVGWQNMMDVSGPHMHGFFGDMSNSNFRDESRMYGGAEWDHNRRMQGQGWDSSVDPWKTQNGHVSVDVSSMSVKDDNSTQGLEGDTLAVQTSHSENNRAKSVEAGSNLTSPAKELALSSPRILFEEAYVDTVAETIDTVERYCRHYLSKLDISVELADAELHTQCTGLLKCEEGCSTNDDGVAVFVNLKDGGKAVRKADPSSLTSLIPIENKSVFQIAMKLYKEQRYEMKGLPEVKYEEPQAPLPDMKIDMEMDGRLSEIGELDTAQKVEQETALPELVREKGEEEERGSSLKDVGMSENEDEEKNGNCSNC